jgi:glucuronokinase
VRIVKTIAYARAGLLGNPSDGFFGKTLSVTVKNFAARVVLYEWPELEIVLSRQDRCRFEQIEDLAEDVRLNGLYGGLRLVKAAIKVFAEYCRESSIPLSGENFSLRYETNIPRQVGLAGSSAIITSVMRALLEFYSVSISREIQANLILQTETQELGIDAGLQDRVCQVYEGLVYMDFDRDFMERHGHGVYEVLDAKLLPSLYLAYRNDLSQVSGLYHSGLRGRWEQGDAEVHAAMRTFADLAEQGRQALLEADYRKLAELFDQNFDTRRQLSRLDPRGEEMVQIARSLGVCAKYAGSGGSIVGICPTEEQLTKLQERFSESGCTLIRLMVA